MGKFQHILKSLRTSHGLTQDELSKSLKVSRSTIGMYEKGAREPDFETLELIADYFNVDISYLLGRTTKTTFIPESNIHYNANEIQLVDNFRKLSSDGQQKVTTYTQRLVDMEADEFEVMAAHANNPTDEQKAHARSVMLDDKNWE